MVACDIIGAAILDPVLPNPVSIPGVTMMGQLECREPVGLPTEHVRLYLIQGVPARGFDEAADRLPAGAAVNLARAANVERGIAFGLLSENSIDLAAHSAAANPKFG